jgi:chemotaxis protein CheD
MSEIRVKVADYAVAQGEVVLSSVGLGSCIAIALYDARTGVGGLAHILVPSPSLARDTSNPAKFPSTAVPMLVEEMRRRGASQEITAKIAGGASMFASLIPAGGINMGERNAVATRQALVDAGLPLVAEDCGGEHGRSVYFHLRDGRLEIRSLKIGDRVL